MPTIPVRAANVSLYAFEPAELSADTFEVVRFTGMEGLSQLFKFELQLVSTNPDIDFAKLVNKPATFTMMRGDEPVPIGGIVTDVSQHGRTADYVAYHATLRPRLWRLALSYQSRIFQEMTVEEILRTVLKEDGLGSSDFRFALSESYEPREYCVQYQETDLNFISRLMEFEGMYYFFEHDDGRDILVITDIRSEHEEIEAPSALRFHEGAGGMVEADEESVARFVCEEQVVTGRVELKDYNYRTPDTMTVESELSGEMPGTRYEYGEHFQDAERGQRLAQVRNEEIEAQRRIMTGESNSMGLRSGYLFTLEEHFRASLNEDYLLTRVEHQGSQRAGLNIGSAQEDGEAEPDYQNAFTCIPATVQYRPPRKTPKPEVPGVVTAKIESAGGDYAYIDDEGRYRAQMHFDQRTDRSDGTKTLPIRMKQAYSGPDYGIHFPNHADTEVLIAYENGDIDRPVALGTTPNPSQKSPSVSENKMQNVIRTWGQNELTFDDTKDEEDILLQATKDHTVNVANDESISIGNDQILSVEHDRTKSVNNDETNTIKNNRTTTVEEGDDALTVKSGDRNVNVDAGDHKKVVKGDRIVEVDSGDDTLTVKTGDRVVDVNTGDHKTTVKTGDRTANINAGDDVVNVKTGDRTIDVNGKIVQQANGEITISSNQKVTISANTEITLQVGPSSIKIAPDGITISGPKVTSSAQALNEITGSMVKIN